MANTYLPNIISFWFIVIFGFLLIRRPWLKNLASILFASGILWLFMGSDHSLYVFVAVYTASSVFIFCNLYELGYGIVNRRLKRRLNVVPASMPGSGEALEALQKAIDHDACKILRGYTGFISKKEPLLCLTKDETSAAIRYRIPIGLATKKICQEGEYQGYYGYVFLPSEEM